MTALTDAPSLLAISAAAPWTRVAFTTYALSLTFFETVVMDALVRARARDITILSDIEGVRCSLSEKGTRGAGRDYQLEPIAAAGGVFHAKISAFIADGDAMLALGSGNLTFGGWAGNLELVEFLHPSFAASAFGDVAGFFETLGEHERMRHAAGDACHGLAGDLRRVAQGKQDRGDIRVLHSLTSGIGDQVLDWATELGGATRLAVVSPYFDDGAGLSHLSGSLGLDRAYVHAHPQTAIGAAPNWPRKGDCFFEPVSMEFAANDARPLHAKAYEVVCRKGRLLVSGSANASGRALDPGGNAEAVVVRILRDGSKSWGWVPATVPAPKPISDETSEAEETGAGVLRAQLNGATVDGWVLTPALRGTATVEQLTSHGTEKLGVAVLDDTGRFRLEAPDLERQSWNAGRITIRVSVGERSSEGYVSSTAAGLAARRLGAMAPRLFAILGGSDTPDDVIALLDWIFEDPHRLPGLAAGSGSSAGAGAPKSDDQIAVSDLVWRDRQTDTFGDDQSEADATARLVEQLRRALRGKKSAYEPPALADSDEGQSDADLRRSEKQRQQHEKSVGRSSDLTGEFIRWAIEPEQLKGWGIFALELVSHMAQRLDWTPNVVRHWTATVVGALTRDTLQPGSEELVSSALLGLVAEASAERVRGAMIRLGISVLGAPPEIGDDPLYCAASSRDVAEVWAEIQTVRSIEEVVASYVSSVKRSPSENEEGFDGALLEQSCPRQWPVLKSALTSEKSRRDVLFGSRGLKACPRCSSVLPTAERDSYRKFFVATAGNCCGKVIVFDGVNE